MLANIRQHAAYIASTVGYVDDQIAEDSRIVTDASASHSYVFRVMQVLFLFVQCCLVFGLCC